MTSRRRHIKFSPCPLERHKGQMWTKLYDVDFERPVVLQTAIPLWSDEWYMEPELSEHMRKDGGSYFFSVEDDTFFDFTHKDWRELLKLFYSRERVFGLVLVFYQDDYYFSTFRAYDWRKHNYYEDHIGDEFWIKYKEEGS